ncbi:MAG TPA: hypothetical protein VKB76_12715 [Ktedonobacterales bacterium]|nr:hypothetical protein [Ktedonobacterales bacterium]
MFNAQGAPVHAPKMMLTMSVTLEEMNNIGPRLPMDVTASHLMIYDAESQTLHYAREIAHLVEAIDKSQPFQRMPEKISALQIRLELIARNCATEMVLPDPMLDALWRYSTEFRRDDERVQRLLHIAGVANIDEFFISAAKQK